MMHRDEAVTITRRYAPGSDTARQRAMLDAVLLLVDSDERFGLLDPDDFERSVRSIWVNGAGNGAPLSDEVVRGSWTHRIWQRAVLDSIRR
jgi:hypothetical protein